MIFLLSPEIMPVLPSQPLVISDCNLEDPVRTFGTNGLWTPTDDKDTCLEMSSISLT